MGAMKIFEAPEYVHGYFSRNFKWAFVPIDPMNVPTKFEVRSFTRSAVPEIIAIIVLGGGCEPPILGKRRP